jgi:hypothetical protein
MLRAMEFSTHRIEVELRRGRSCHDDHLAPARKQLPSEAKRFADQTLDPIAHDGDANALGYSDPELSAVATRMKQ